MKIDPKEINLLLEDSLTRNILFSHIENESLNQENSIRKAKRKEIYEPVRFKCEVKDETK
jgi:hypothetical protein